MSEATDVAGPAADPGRDGRRGARSGPSWLVKVYPCAFLVFLAFPLTDAWSRGGWQRWLAIVVVPVFCVVYAAPYLGDRLGPAGRGRDRRLTAWLGALLLLTALLVASSPTFGLTGMTYVACGAAALAPPRPGLALVAASGMVALLALLAMGAGPVIAPAISGWILLTGLAVWGSVSIGRQHEAVAEAREERAELAVELERTRLARDLHDILGHSLTVIAVKAELAGRLVDADPVRAKVELADLERLSRDALADVRTTVSDYRRLSLPTELARAGQALEAAGITAVLPSAADEVPTELRDPFAWVVREGVTNTIRHSGARTCTITLTPVSVEVRDDGRATVSPVAGNGLTGLRERARQAGLRIVTETSRPRGFVLRAEEAS